MTLPLNKKLHIHYPSSDGKPMADNTRQWNWISYIKHNLEEITKGKDIFVASDLLWYPVEGNNRFRVAPDVMVAIGRPKGDRNSYLQWKEGHIAPQIVWEILSPSNTKKEMSKKRTLYDNLEVEEYYVYDPDFNRLQIYQRNSNKLVQKKASEWTSALLKFKVELTDSTLQLFRPDGTPFKSFSELELEMEAAKLEAQAAKKKAAALAAKLRELGIDPDSLG